jgi:lantibiotic modifying enzyme
LEPALVAVFDSLERDGAKLGASLSRSYPDEPLARSALAFSFGNAVYFGAAHGLAGVLFAMLHLPEQCLRPGTRERIVGALDFLVDIQTKDGNFPVALGTHSASLVHWCHGAPGVIPTLCKAHEVFGDDRYLQSALRAGDCVWSRGLLRKGVSVCHGIAGSALSHLTLYRATGNSRHLYRALRTCEATWFEPCLEAIAQTPDPQRYVPGVPNYPDSLMEGKAGLLYAYVSIQRPDQSSFPGYDGAT